MKYTILSHEQDGFHAEKGYVEMRDFYMAALMYLTGHGIIARNHVYAEIAHFPSRCIISSRKTLVLWPHASQALMMHQIGKCAISTWPWVLAIKQPNMPRIYFWEDGAVNFDCHIRE